MRIINNIRPDRQTVMFSATFPRTVEQLAKKILTKPLEIIVGGRSVVCSDVEQHVEVVQEDAKFKRLLELLKDWQDKGLVLIFVDRQEACDRLFTDLLRVGHSCLSLHGGKDQQDRDFTIDDFKRKVATIMVATSVAARGLDVKDLNLVVNYDVPNHMEDYVHRVGRTGRAGAKGTSYTFITPDEERYAPDIVKALESSGTAIPEDLAKLASSYVEKKNSGQTVQVHGSGYGGKGYRFDEAEERKRQEDRKRQKKAYGVEESESEDEYGGEDDEKAEPKTPPAPGEKDAATQQALAQILAKTSGMPSQQRLQEIAASLAASKKIFTNGEHFAEELEINDYPQQARWKVTHKDALSAITEFTGAAITTRGSYVPPGRPPAPGERKLYLYIEGGDATTVRQAKTEIKRILEEAAATAVPEKAMYGKYSVV